MAPSDPMSVAPSCVGGRTARADLEPGILKPQFDRPVGMLVADGENLPSILCVKNPLGLDYPLSRDIDEIGQIGVGDGVGQLDCFVLEFGRDERGTTGFEFRPVAGHTRTPHWAAIAFAIPG